MKTRLRALTNVMACFVLLHTADTAFAQEILRITRQPQDQSRSLDSLTTFSVEVESTSAAVSFQWEQHKSTDLDWTAIPDATSSNYTFIITACGQNRSRYRCQISTLETNAVSAEAELQVICDCDPPVIINVSSPASLDSVLVVFDVNMIPESATDIFNYSIAGLELVVARMLNPWTVALTTGPQIPGQTYTLYTANISNYSDPDCGVNLVSPFIGIDFTAPARMPGLLRRDYFANIAGFQLAALTNHAKFPFFPDEVSYVSSFEAPRMIGSSYGTRLSGFVLPPVTGAYRFFLSSAGESQLNLSTDESPANRNQIAFAWNWSGPRDWVNRSDPISLEEGKRYYIEVLLKEFVGREHVAVAWQLPGGTPPRNGTGVIPGTWLGTYVSPVAASLQIIQQPRPAYSSLDCKASFSVEARVQPPGAPVSYQWQRDGVEIPGATTATYVTGYLTGADHGTGFRCRVSAPGISVLSDEGFLTIGGDVVLPVLEGAFAWDSNKVALVFNHPVEPLDPGYFEFVPGLRIDSAALHSSDPAIVLVDTATMNPGTPYRLTVRDIHDASGNFISPNPSQATLIGHTPIPTETLRSWLVGSRLVLQWTHPMAVLQTSDSINGPWQDFADATSPVVVGARPNYCNSPALHPRHFFRLRSED